MNYVIAGLLLLILLVVALRRGRTAWVRPDRGWTLRDNETWARPTAGGAWVALAVTHDGEPVLDAEGNGRVWAESVQFVVSS